MIVIYFRQIKEMNAALERDKGSFYTIHIYNGCVKKRPSLVLSLPNVYKPTKCVRSERFSDRVCVLKVERYMLHRKDRLYSLVFRYALLLGIS